MTGVQTCALPIFTIDRLGEQNETGRPAEVEADEDAVNARAARGAGGRTTGEVILALDESYRRLRREVARMTNDQVGANKSWAATIIAANTWRHYDEHLPDLDRRSA